MTARRTLSLRARLGWGLLLVGVIATIIAIIVTVTTKSFLLSQMDDKLDAYAGPRSFDQSVAPLPDPSKQPNDTVRPSEAFRGFLTEDGTLSVFFSPNVGGVSDTEPVLSAENLTDQSTHFTAPSTDGTGEFRVLARPSGSGWDITALPLDDVRSATQRLLVIEGIGIVLIAGALGVVAWWVNRLGITPMRRMVDASTRIAHGDLHVRLNTDQGGTETNELAHSLNQVIETLTTAVQQSEKSETRLREFVADASHELRTPLTTVLGYSELYRRGALQNAEDLDDAWARTEAEASRMRRLVEDLLTLAKYDNAPDLQLKQTDVKELVDSVVSDATVAYPDTEFTVSGDQVSGLVDSDRLRQALLNLLANAALHGGAHVTVNTTFSHEHTVQISVHDDGPGMPDDIAARATERFVRGDSSRQRATGGAGLGLAITAAIVRAHNGELAVASSAEDGTTITLTFPSK